MKTLIAIVVVLAPGLAYANAGVFEGSGHTVKLIRSENVQLRSEKVMIIPGRGRFLFDGGVGGMDRVQYYCTFVLKNRSPKAVTVQVGFPLTSEFARGDAWKAEDATNLVFQYKFIARDGDKTYHVRFVPHDQDEKLGAIFLWDMTFQANETRELRVAYEIPMAMGLATTANSPQAAVREKGKAWFTTLESAMGEGLEYITVTGQSWAGPIENATFEVYVGGFEKYLAQRGFLDALPPSIAADDKKAGSRSSWNIKSGLVHRQIDPAGWKEKDGVLRWEFKNYRPKDAISVSYIQTFLPSKAEDMSLFAGVLGDKPSAEDFRDLREILLASWGIVPEHEAIRRFAAAQVWYKPKSGLTVEKLDAQQKAALSALEACSPTGGAPQKDDAERRELKRAGSQP